ncbi:MAG: oxaloacetate decarboxylase gamma subunit [Paraglaciecola sp.]|jgi:oxaloacetate decarboxylase gamma subunit
MHTELADMLTEAATLLLIGMSMVFIFLSLLIGAVNLIAWISAKSPETQNKIITKQASRNVAGSSTTQNICPSTVAAISAAIHQHRNAS